MNNLKTGSQTCTPTDIRSLTDELSAAVTTLSEISMLKEIDAHCSIKLFSRLPLHVQRRWSKLAFEKKLDESCYPGISELAEFLVESAVLLMFLCMGAYSITSPVFCPVKTHSL